MHLLSPVIATVVVIPANTEGFVSVKSGANRQTTFHSLLNHIQICSKGCHCTALRVCGGSFTDDLRIGATLVAGRNHPGGGLAILDGPQT